MPASYTTFAGLLVCLCALLLSACSRDNSLSVPEAYVAPDKVNCEDIPPDDLVLLKGINISNTIISPKFDLNVTSYTAHVDYLVDSVVVTPGQIVPDNYDDINSVSVKVGDESIDIDKSSTAIALAEGNNEIVVTVDAVVKAVGAVGECKTYDANNNVVQNSVPDTRTYTITVRRGLLTEVNEQIIQPAQTAIDSGDNFGHSVSIDGDTMVVGVYHEDSNARGIFSVGALQGELEDNSAEDSGAVYIYKKNTNGEWLHTFYVKSSNSEAGDLFGSSVSLNGDFLVVSAPGEDSHASGIDGREDSNMSPESGAVYVFKRHITGWKQQHYIKTANNYPGANGFFGEHVSVRDDLMVISAPAKDASVEQDQSNSGAVYVYRYKPELVRWVGEATLSADIARADDRFGTSVALGDNTVVVGSPYEDTNFAGVQSERAVLSDLKKGDPRLDVSKVNSGAVYVFNKIASLWEQSAYIKASNSDAGDLFGSALAVSGKYIVVGARREDSNGVGLNRNMNNNDLLNSGAAYLYQLREGVWLETNYIKPAIAKAGSEFGSAIAFDNNDLMIGAPLFVNSDENSLGRVHGYSVLASAMAQNDVKKSALDQVGEYYGKSLAVSGSVVVVGAEGHSYKASGPELENAGIVYVYQ